MTHLVVARMWVVLAAALSMVAAPVASLAAADVAAAPASLFSPTDKSFIGKYLQPGSYMPLSDVKAGMTGYGLTVWHGTKVERFNLQVIGVVKKILNGRDAILARLSGGEMGKNCVVKGMSGSPCYINGKLIGAVSFGFDFSKEPICGITPIVDMLDALADNTPAKGRIAHLAPPPWAVRDGGSMEMTNTSGGGMKMTPLVSPISLTGFSPRAEAYLSKRFQDIGLGVSSGSAGAMDPQLMTGSADKSVQPGSAVAVLLASGDFSMAATGTATARFGDKVVAFGHPFMQGGSIDFPMASAFVHQVMPGYNVSFKLASPTNVVGSITADRPWGIGGKMNRASKMIPATYTVVDEPRKISQTYNVQVIDHPELTPDILAATATSAVDATHQTAGPYVAKVESRFEAEGIAPIVRTDRFATGMAPKSFLDLFMGGDPVARYVSRTANSLTNNEFQKTSLKKVSLKITIQDGHETAKIDRVFIDKPFAAPGEEVKVTAILKPFDHEPVEETMTFNVPRDVPDGNMLVGIAGGQDYEYIKNRLGIVEPDPENLQQIAQRIRDDGRGDQISVIVGLPEQSLMINGTKLVNPPAHWTKVFYSNRHTKGPTLVKGEMRRTKDSPWMLHGSHILALEVRSPDKASARQAPYPISAPYNNDDVAITEQAQKAMASVPSVRRGSSRGGGFGSSITNSTSSTTNGTLGTSSTSITSTSTSSSKTTTSSTITASTGKEYPHVRPVQIWRQDSDEEFRAGKLDDSTVDSWGRISPGFQSLANKQVSSEDQIWSGVHANGHFYYGSGSEVWRWQGGSSKPEKVAKLEGLFIPAMATDSKGIVYAAAVPSGHVWAIDTKTPAAKAQIVFKTTEPIIASLAVDDKDNLYAGTASTGKVYKIDATRKSSVIFDSGQAHILSMFYHKPESTLYIGTGEKGSVYSIDQSGKAKAVYQSPDHFVTGVVKDAKGDLYVSSAGSGHLVRVTPNGESTTLATSEAFYTLHYDAETDSVISGDAEGDVTMAIIDPMTKQSYFMPVSHTEQEAVLALASNGKNLYVGSSNLAVLREFQMQLSDKPLYISAVKDSGRPARWSRIHTYGPFNERNQDLASKLRIETRTGETAKPDETWAPWQSATLSSDSFAVASPVGRYFQYRLSWDTSKDKLGSEKIDKLTLGRIDTTFLPTNTLPQISNISVKSGVAVAGKQDISVTGTDSDGDNLMLSMDVSTDGGTTWKPLKEEIRSKTSKKDSSSSSKATIVSDDDDIISADGKGKDKDKDAKDPEKKEDTSTGDKTEDKPSDDKAKDEPKEGDKEKPPVVEDKDELSLMEESASTEDLDAPRHTARKKKEGSGDKKSHDDKKSDDKKTDDDKKADGDKKADSDKDSKTADKDKKSTKDKVAKDTKKKTPLHTSSSSSDSGSKSSEGGSTTETFTYNWDTKKQKDGNYLVRFTVDDKLSNPSGAQQVVNLRSVIVDNGAPEIELMEHKRQADGKLEFKVTASDALTSIANATYKIDDGEPFALSFDADSIDGLKATMVASNVKVESGSHKVEVKVSDRAGNTATKTITVK